MGTWRGIQVAFILGSLFMILLIIVYWDDIGGFNLYPLQEHKHESPHSDPQPQATSGPSHSFSTSRAQTSSYFSIPTTASSMAVVPEETRAAEKHAEEEGRERQEQREEKGTEDVEKEWTNTAVDDRKQEVRKKRIMDKCSGKDAVEFPGRTRTFEQIPNRELDHLIVDDTHKIIYCYVPKVHLPCVCVCLWCMSASVLVRTCLWWYACGR